MLRKSEGAPFVSDNGHYIVDCDFGLIHDPAALQRALKELPGIMETGLFLNMATDIVVGGKDGVRWLTRPRIG